MNQVENVFRKIAKTQTLLSVLDCEFLCFKAEDSREMNRKNVKRLKDSFREEMRLGGNAARKQSPERYLQKVSPDRQH